ncbi:MAG TPA: serine hydrolase domain-containing protein, partial [Longimicrobiales bacterium]|nr:serine hydrolase domain-containing protein [Longimicrobiales bacterium]
MRPTLVVPLALAASVTLAPPDLHGQALDLARAPSYGAWGDAVDAARDVVAAHVGEEGIPGLSVAVAVDGELVWSDAFGFADLENSVAATPATRFRIASISKALTAAAIGALVEEGRLDLDAPVQAYVPNFP